MKNHLYKAALLAALGLALSPVAKASDMYVGFNDYAGTTTSGTDAGQDYVIDLGAYTQFTTTASFSDPISGSSFSSAFGGDANALNNVAVGAVAGGATGTGSFLMATGNPTVTSGTKWSNAKNDASSIPTGTYAAAGSATSPTWDYFVAQGPSVGDQSGNGVYSEVDPTVESFLSGGDVTLTLWESTLASGIGKTPTAFTELGTLTIDANSSGTGADTITFTGADVSAAPEPSTYGIFAGVGLLGLALRRQFAATVA